MIKKIKKLFHRHDFECEFKAKRALIRFLMNLGIESAEEKAEYMYEIAQFRIRMNMR